VIFMHRILVDACGWAAVIEAGINIDQALLDCAGTKELAIVPNVITELKALKDRKLMVSMLVSKAKMITPLVDSGNHTDDQLLALAKERSWPILTVDTELKRRLSQANIPWIEVSGQSHLRQVG
jgi:rRNA-processing protein FCF1|tara:strand:- start:220 stop:591 length:372 start_codon:yes stop_codon:yes gene_type:complete